MRHGHERIALFLIMLASSAIIGCGTSESAGGGDASPEPRRDAEAQATRADLCGNGLDDDANGLVDDGCPCGPGETQPCFAGAVAARGRGACTDGTQRCEPPVGTEWSDWGAHACEGWIGPGAETCDGSDRDCDGAVDEGCPCTDGSERGCGGDVPLPAPCREGAQRCVGGAWTACEGAVLPSAELCDNGVDDDCDGEIDPARLCACAPVPEVCGDGVDDDCDGDVDEGCCASASEACGDGLDDDCDGSVDEGCATLGAPVLRAPRLGHRTGSLHAAHGDGGPDDHPLRPELVWEPTAGALDYEIELDDSCVFPGYRGCSFPSPEHVARVAGRAVPGGGLAHRLESDLPVARTVPVGTRYAWRVRACEASGCGSWSEVRYLHAGRTPGDLDGDGFAEVAVGVTGRAAGAGVEARWSVVVYRGSAGGPIEPPLTELDLGSTPGLLVWLASDLDLDADGFGDLVIGSDFASGGGEVRVAYGSAAGPVVREEPLRGAGGRFGMALDGADLDGDGFDDLVVGHGMDATHVRVYRGSASGLVRDEPTQLVNPLPGGGAGFGRHVSCDADLNGDGYSDLAVSAYWGGARAEGRVVVFPGGASFGSPRVLEPPTPQSMANFGYIAMLADSSGDGFGDLAVSSNQHSSPERNEGAVWAFGGSRASLLGAPTFHDSPRDVALAGFGWGLEVGDVDGDGRDDLFVGEALGVGPRTGCRAFEREVECTWGAGHVLYGDVLGTARPPSMLANPHTPAHATMRVFAQYAALSDVDGDGFDDVIVSDYRHGELDEPGDGPSPTPVGIVYVYGGGPSGVRPGAPRELRPPVSGMYYFGAGVD